MMSIEPANSCCRSYEALSQITQFCCTASYSSWRTGWNAELVPSHLLLFKLEKLIQLMIIPSYWQTTSILALQTWRLMTTRQMIKIKSHFTREFWKNSALIMITLVDIKWRKVPKNIFTSLEKHHYGGRVVRSESSLQTVMHSVALEIVDLEKKEFTARRLCPMTVNEKISIKFKQIVLISLNVWALII